MRLGWSQRTALHVCAQDRSSVQSGGAASTALAVPEAATVEGAWCRCNRQDHQSAVAIVLSSFRVAHPVPLSTKNAPWTPHAPPPHLPTCLFVCPHACGRPGKAASTEHRQHHWLYTLGHLCAANMTEIREYEPVYPDGLESWYLDGMESRGQDTEDPRGPRAGLLAPGTLDECRSLRRAYRCGRTVLLAPAPPPCSVRT